MRIRGADALVFLTHGLVVVATLALPGILFLESFRIDDDWSTKAWRNVFVDAPRLWTLAKSSAIALAVCLSTLLVVGTALACALFKTDVLFARTSCVLLVLAAAIPLHVTGASLVAPSGPTLPSKSVLELGLAHALAHLPVFVLLLGAALRSVPREIEETALADGCGSRQTLLRVTLPNARSGLVLATVLVGLWVSTDYSVSDFLQVRTFAEEVYTQFSLWNRSAEAIVVSVPQIAVLTLVLWLARAHLVRLDAMPTRPSTPLRLPLGYWRRPVSFVGLGVCAGLVAFPLLRVFGNLPTDRGLLYWAEIFQERLQLSLLTSVIAAAICALLAVGLAWAIVRSERLRTPLLLWVAVLLATPAPVLGIGIIRVANRWLEPLYESSWMLVVAYVVRFLPVAVLLLIPLVRSISRDLGYAARVDGCSTSGVLWRVVHPLALRGTLAALAVVTILSLGEIPCSLLTQPPGMSTVAHDFASFIHYGLQQEAAGLCLLTLAAIALPAGALALLYGRSAGEGQENPTRRGRTPEDLF